MEDDIEKIVYGTDLTITSFNGVGRIPVLYGGYILITESSNELLTEDNYKLRTEADITSINIKIIYGDSISQLNFAFPLENGQILKAEDYIDGDGLHIDGNTIAFTARQITAYQSLQNIPLYNGITHISVIDSNPAIMEFHYYVDEEEDNKIYVLNKNEYLLAVFDKDDEETLINPRIEKKQNSESVFTFTINLKNPKWEEIKDPENLYLVDGMIFSTNFDGSFTEKISENDEQTMEVKAYERQQLLSRKYVRAWNSETNLQSIDTFMVVILANGNLPLKNNGNEITTRYPKGSSGYVLEGLLYGTGWTVGTCDIYEYENGQLVTNNNDPVYSKFDLETDQVNIYDNILKVQELWGGILVFDSVNKIVHHRSETTYLPYNGYEVKYQKNMQSLEKKYNNKIITKLCPLGEGGLNIANINNNNVWLEDYTYTTTQLEGIENNPDITDPVQLKKWGERKLQMLCRPSTELDVKVALLYQLEGYELEKVDLNHIVDVINYNDIDTDYIQLRVVEYEYALWDKSDATVKLSDITLDSTDIFQKAVTATNSINTGTLEASKVITLYKGGESVEKSIFNMNNKVEFSYSTLTEEDTGIIARVTRTEDEYNTLSGVVSKHEEDIGEWDISSGNISSTVSKVKTEVNNNYTEIIKKLDDYATNDDIVSVRETVKTWQDSTSYAIRVAESIERNGTSKVVTETGFTFDKDGLTIEKSGANTKSILDETGLDIKDATGSSDESLLFAGYDEIKGETIVKSKNMTVEKYLTIGSYSRIEDFENGTGVFWIGG